MKGRRQRAEDLSLLAITVFGLAAFLFPVAGHVSSASGERDALFIGLICASGVIVLALGLQAHRLSARLLAVLAALVAVDAVLRVAVVIGLAGFSPIFFLMIAGGFVMGPGFGFALGAFTLLLSAVLTAGFGPWLPYQMLGAGWVGMGAGIIGRLVGGRPTRTAIVTLAVYGCLAGFAYGMLLDLWDWPLVLGGAATPISWAPGLPVEVLLSRFGGFYLATSLVYDAFRAVGNALLVGLLGGQVISALLRFRLRFLVEWVPVGNMSPNVGAAPRYRAATGAD